MPPAWRLALNNLRASRWRTVLMVVAVAIAASLVTAVSSAVDSGRASTEASFTRFLGNANARVVRPGGGRIDAEILELVRTWPEVDVAEGRLAASLTLIRADRAEDPETGLPRRLTPGAIGIDFDLITRFRDVPLADGVLPKDADEVLIDPMTAEALDATVGTTLEVQRFGTPILLTVCGIYERQNLGALQRPRIYVDRGVLAEAANLAGRLTSIYIIVDEDVDVPAMCAARAEEVPTEASLEPAEMIRTGFDRRLRGSQIGLIVGSVTAFLSAGFIIVTGMTTGVTERQRELALLRAIGATRTQIFFSQIGLGGVFGGLGALIGAPLGVAFAGVLVFLYREFLAEGLSIHWPGFWLAVFGSIAAGLIGAIIPAWQASRATPLEAMAVRAKPPARRAILLTAVAGIACLAIAHSALLLAPDPQVRFYLYVGLALPLLLIGMFVLAVPLLMIVVPLTAPVISRWLKLPPDLLRGVMTMAPWRHGFTAGSLMLGMAILVSTWATGLSIQRGFLERIRFADGFAFRPTGISEEQVNAIKELPFVEEISPIGQVQVQIKGEQVFGLEGVSPRNVVLVGFNAEQFFRLNHVDWIAGTPNVGLPKLLSGDGIVVAERFLVAKGYDVGDRITLSVGRIEESFEIVGVIGAAGLDIASQIFGIQNAYSELAVSCVFLDASVVESVFKNGDIHLVQVMLSDDIDDAAAEEAVATAAPGVLFRSGRNIIAMLRDLMAAGLAVQTTVAFGALLLASFAVGNVIAADVEQRRFEFGVMRSVGTSKSIIRRLVAAEAVLLGITGGLTGTALGIQFAIIDRLNLRDLAGLNLPTVVPWLPVLIGWLVLLAISALVTWPAVRRIIRVPTSELVA